MSNQKNKNIDLRLQHNYAKEIQNCTVTYFVNVNQKTKQKL